MVFVGLSLSRSFRRAPPKTTKDLYKSKKEKDQMIFSHMTSFQLP